MEFEKKIAVLGSTGSIGTQTLEIAREYKGIKIEQCLHIQILI